MRFSGIHLRAILQYMAELLFFIMSLNITILKFQLHLPGANELKEV